MESLLKLQLGKQMAANEATVVLKYWVIYTEF